MLPDEIYVYRDSFFDGKCAEICYDNQSKTIMTLECV